MGSKTKIRSKRATKNQSALRQVWEDEERLIKRWRKLADMHEGYNGWQIVANAQRICADELAASRAVSLRRSAEAIR